MAKVLQVSRTAARRGGHLIKEITYTYLCGWWSVAQTGLIMALIVSAVLYDGALHDFADHQ